MSMTRKTADEVYRSEKQFNLNLTSIPITILLKYDANAREQFKHKSMRIIDVYANTITFVANQLFKKVTIEDLMNPDSYNSCANNGVSEIFELYNAHFFYVKNSIASQANPAQCHLLIERWIFIAKKLTDMGNFFSAQVIFAALNDHGILSLMKTHKNMLSPPATKSFNFLQEIYHPDNKNELLKLIHKKSGFKLTHLDFAEKAMTKLDGFIQNKEFEIDNFQERLQQTHQEYHVKIDAAAGNINYQDEHMNEEVMKKVNRLSRELKSENEQITTAIERARKSIEESKEEQKKELDAEFKMRCVPQDTIADQANVSNALIQNFMSNEIMLHSKNMRKRAELKLSITKLEGKLACSPSSDIRKELKKVQDEFTLLDNKVKIYDKEINDKLKDRQSSFALWSPPTKQVMKITKPLKSTKVKRTLNDTAKLAAERQVSEHSVADIMYERTNSFSSSYTKMLSQLRTSSEPDLKQLSRKKTGELNRIEEVASEIQNKMRDSKKSNIKQKAYASLSKVKAAMYCVSGAPQTKLTHSRSAGELFVSRIGK